MFFKVVLVLVILAVAANASPANKVWILWNYWDEKSSKFDSKIQVKRQIPTPPMPPGMPAPPMPPGMIVQFADLQRAKRQAPETTPPSRVARQAPETPPPARFARQAETTPPSRVARSVFGDQEVPKTIAQEAYFSKITTINGEK